MARSLRLLLAVLATLLLLGSIALAETTGDQPGQAEETITVSIPSGTYSVKQLNNGQALSLEDFGQLLVPGKPKLPSRIFAVAIPPGAEILGVSYQLGTPQKLSGDFHIVPSPLPRVIGDENPLLYEQDLQRYQANYQAVYGNDEPYPAKPVEFMRQAGYREYNLVDVRVTPFTYRPQSKELTYYPDISVEVSYRLPEGAARTVSVGTNPRTERSATDLILNYQEASEWYTPTASAREIKDYVIITLASLTSYLTPLVDWETAKGRSVEIVTTAWISQNYSGYDLAAQMRAFLLDKYPAEEWGILDVLLVGDYDDVPMRRTYQDLGYGRPETDFYYAELSSPDSLSWDSDGDHRYGEGSDPIDFYSEVNVGRIPWSDPGTVQSICEKSVGFEQSGDPAFKKNMLLLGAYFWADTDNAVLMEYKTDASLHSWMSDWTFTRMYEQNSGYYSSFTCDYPLLHSNVMDVWPENHFAFVNWAGHGSPTSTHILGLGAPSFIQSSDCSQLDDDYPAIIFADACSNSDTDYPNIGRAMLGQGAVGFVGATKVAYGCPGWDDPSGGSSQSMDYYFTTAVTSGEYSQGEALQLALRNMYNYGLWDALKYETFEWGALWGNPNLWMGEAPLSLTMVGVPPEWINPDSSTAVTVQISEGIDSYIPGSGKLYYRLNGMRFLNTPLVHVEGNFYEATIPGPACEDLVEFYFTALGEACGQIYCPSEAPDEVFSSRVAELTPVFEDDFQLDRGWTTVSDPELIGGAWMRGEPLGGGDRGDPAADYDGSGNCFLTDNADGDTDVEGGMTSLISPVFDLTEDKGTVSYARWFSNDTGGDPYNDVMEVYVSSNNGTTWLLVETVGPLQQATGGWFKYSFWVDDFVTRTDDMRVRFDVSDYGVSSIVEAGIDDFAVSMLQCLGPILCGDADNNELVNISDGVFLVSYIFGGGPAPEITAAADVNCDSLINISDAVYLIAYIFGGGPEPCANCSK